MKNKVFRLLFFFLTLSLFAENTIIEKPSLLILYSYHPGNDWEDAVHHALMDELKKILPGSRLYVEYLDTKRFDPASREDDNLKRLGEYRDVPLSLLLLWTTMPWPFWPVPPLLSVRISLSSSAG